MLTSSRVSAGPSESTRVYDGRLVMRQMNTKLFGPFLVGLACLLVAACSTSGDGVPAGPPDGGMNEPDGGGEPFEPSWPPEPASLQRPRTLGAGADLAGIRTKLSTEPYRSWMQRMARRVADGRAQDPDDHLRGPERMKANAARSLATFYLLGWTVVDEEPVPFGSSEEREAIGAEAAALLESMYTESRIAVSPPLGGWDRDITTSEEIIMWASAYDTLVGGGYDLGDKEEVIVENIISLTSALYENYRDPDTANGFPILHQNNHRSKVGCAFITAAIVLAERESESGDSGTIDYEDPAGWAQYGFELLEKILEYSHLTEDGVYSEGPFYFRYTTQNLVPTARAWDQWVAGEPWPVAEDVERVSPWRDPRIVRATRWMLDVMLPDGSLAPHDDGNVGRRHYYGLSPFGDEDPSELYWAWGLARDSQYLAAPYPYPSDGNIELAPDALFAFDSSVTPHAPEGSPTRIYEKGGVAALRSGWEQDDVVAVVLGEHDVASSFGRGPDGDPVFPDSHEHAEPASFMFYAYGERLLLDPGYLEFWRRGEVSKPQDHNMILVDGVGPVDYLRASTDWGTFNPDLPPPADGMAYLSSAFDSAHADGVTVNTEYGSGEYGAPGGAAIERRFVFASNRYLVIADRATSLEAGVSHDFQWRFHGNGGGASLPGDKPNIGTFERTGGEARWHRENASVVVATVSSNGAMSYSEDISFHEPGGRDDNGDVARSSHTVWQASRTGSDVRALSVVLPYRNDATAPMVATTDDSVVLTEGTWRSEARLQSDGSLLVTESVDGTETLRYAERGADLRHVDLDADGRFVEAISAVEAEWYLDPIPAELSVEGVPFEPLTLDGACGMTSEGGTLSVRTAGSRFGLRAGSGNGRPAAVISAPASATIGAKFALDAALSCDPDDDVLRYSWSLTAAPAGSHWPLVDASAEEATLTPDVAGSYRVALAVTDSKGARSDLAFLEIEVEEP